MKRCSQIAETHRMFNRKIFRQRNDVIWRCFDIFCKSSLIFVHQMHIVWVKCKHSLKSHGLAQSFPSFQGKLIGRVIQEGINPNFLTFFQPFHMFAKFWDVAYSIRTQNGWQSGADKKSARLSNIFHGRCYKSGFYFHQNIFVPQFGECNLFNLKRFS